MFISHRHLTAFAVITILCVGALSGLAGPQASGNAQAARATQPAPGMGDRLDLRTVHVVTMPGLYGLATPPPGHVYAVVDGWLVRLDANTGVLRSRVRPVNQILD